MMPPDPSAHVLGGLVVHEIRFYHFPQFRILGDRLSLNSAVFSFHSSPGMRIYGIVWPALPSVGLEFVPNRAWRNSYGFRYLGEGVLLAPEYLDLVSVSFR